MFRILGENKLNNEVDINFFLNDKKIRIFQSMYSYFTHEFFNSCDYLEKKKEK